MIHNFCSKTYFGLENPALICNHSPHLRVSWGFSFMMSLIMWWFYWRDITEITVAELYCVFIDYLTQNTFFRKMFSNKLLKYLAYVCFNTLAMWGVEPDYHPFAFLYLRRVISNIFMCISDALMKSTFSKCFGVVSIDLFIVIYL